MKEGWEYKRLKDVATFTRGLTYSKNDEAEISNNIVLRSNNVDLSTGKLNFDELKYLRPEFSIPEEKKVKKGSLLMCMSNGSKIHLGKVALINEDYPYAFGGFMALVTPSEELNPQFFHYSLSSPEYKDFIKKLSEGANINNIKVKELELFTIPIPPLSEQQSIVDYLDSAFAKIDAMKANAEKRLNEAQALFQASLKKMLEPKEGWEEKKLGEIAFFSQGIQVDVNLQTERCSPGKVRFLRIIDVTQGNVPPRYIDDPGERYYLKADEIAMVRYGTVGFVCYGFEGVIANNLFKVSIKDKSKLQSNYLQYYLKSDLFQSHIRKGVGGAALPAIKFGDIKHIMLGYPSLSEQKSIVATLDSLKSKVDRLQANYDKISQECDALKQAILRQVFE